MKRVVILLSHPLFGQGVESLLRREEGMEIIGRETDATKIIERVTTLRPDVVIMDSADPACDPAPVMMRILREGLATTVVALNVQDNTMCVYRGDQRVVTEVRDLVEAIEHRAAA